jgi:hypothetical protein
MYDCVLTRATLVRHLELQTAPTKLDVATVNEYFQTYRFTSINFGNFLNLIYY